MITRLRDVPELVDRIQILLQRDAKQIRWRPDAGETEFQAAHESFDAIELSTNADERALMQTAIVRLEALLREDSDDELGRSEDRYR
jgi:hypothetical protein